LIRPRAVVVATGSELVRGERSDLNGPFLAREALKHGLEPVRIVIVGDAPEELEAALRAALAEADAVLTSGGLGPTHDDRTVELVARALGVGLHVEPELERRIEAVSRAVAERLRRPYADFEVGVTKQATVPDGAVVLGLAGTAPGLLVANGRGVVVVLPGPPAELRRLWPNALETEPFRALLARTRPPGRRVLRLFGVSESAVARALAEAGGDGDGVEVTICARDFEIHVDIVVEPGAEERADALEARFVPPLERWLYGRDERPIEEHVLSLLRAQGQTLAVAESCSGGLVAARLTSVPGSSEVFLGGVVAYADEVKVRELGVPAELIERHGAVSAEVAEAMARGARERLRADVAVSVTGVAGPGGGTPEKPVGLVYLHAEGPSGGLGREFSFPGDRGSIRARATVGALHLVRRLLTRSPDEGV
jgi:competence/damage-inducible protein CinA-like protein